MNETILVVQTCHLPQFFYVAARLKERHAGKRFEALMIDDPQARFYTQVFPIFDRVRYVKGGKALEALPSAGYDSVILPLLNRGYRKIKKLASRIRAPRLESDFEGETKPLSRLRLIQSLARPLHIPTPSFLDYLSRFPHRPKGEKLLVIQSCHRSLLACTSAQVERMIGPGYETTLLRATSWKAIRERVRGQKFDAAVVFFSGEGGYFLPRLVPFLLRIPKILVVNENGHCFYASWKSLARFWFERLRHGARQPSRRRTRILLIQTDSASYLRHAAGRLKSPGLFPDAELIAFCQRKDRVALADVPEIDRLHCLPRGGWKEAYRFRRRVSRLQADIVAGVFSGRSTSRKEKRLFFGIPASRRLAFNARLDCYEVALTRLLWMVRREPLLFAEEMDDSRGTAAMLLVQTADDFRTLRALARLQDPKVARPARTFILCENNRRGMFENVPGVARIYSYDPDSLLDAFRTLRRIRSVPLEVVAGVFTGERTRRLQKLLYFLVSANNRLVFNGRLDCFYLRGSKFWLLFSRRRLEARDVVWEAGGLGRGSSKGAILLIQTADDTSAVKALARLRDPKVARPAPILVFCRRDKRPLFENAAGVARVYTYDPEKPYQAFRVLRELRRINVEVVAGLFTGEPIYRAQKLIFFLMRSNHRLVFNAYLDCYYLSRSNFWMLFQRRNQDERGRLWMVPALRLLAKGALFLPRFLFLVIWVTGRKLRRAYSLGQ